MARTHRKLAEADARDDEDPEQHVTIIFVVMVGTVRLIAAILTMMIVMMAIVELIAAVYRVRGRSNID